MKTHSQDPDIVAQFKQGLDEHNAGNLSAAKKMYHKILAIQPDHCEANHNIGIVLVAKNELIKALKFFKSALNANPNVSLFWASYIDTLAKLERIIEAKALIKAAKNSGMFCENIKAISHRLDIENQEPLEKDTLEIDEFITQQKFDDAIKACLNLLETYPSSAILNITLGKCYFKLFQIDLAIFSCTKATEYWPQSEVSFVLLAQIYSSQGNTEQAIKNLSKAVKLKSNDHEIHLLLGEELIENGDFDAAIDSFEQALKINPDYAEAYNNMGKALLIKGDLDAAIDNCKQALKIRPDYADAYFNIGSALKNKGELDAAISSYKQVLKINPDCSEAYQNMGNALKEQGKLEEAIEICKLVLKIKPDDAGGYYNMGNALQENMDLDAAIDSYNQAIKINPRYVDAYNNKGNVLMDKGSTKASIKSYNRALDIEPDNAEVLFNRSVAQLTQGDFKNGWLQYDRRLEENSYNDTILKLIFQHSISNKPKWKPTDGGRVLLWGEQGIGDQVMFASMISELHANLDQLIIQVDERLIPLFKRSFPQDIIYYSNKIILPEALYDSSIPFGSLPMHFRTDLKSFTKTSGAYLESDKILSTKLRKKLKANSNHYLVGVSWMGGSNQNVRHINEAKNKSIDLAQISQSLATKNVKLVNLQYGNTDCECERLKNINRINIHNVSGIDKFNDIDGFTALIDACDHIVSINNLTVHLAGALGKKTSVLLPFSSDWRWGQKKEYSYWHSSLKLFRQEKILDWSAPLKNLKMEFDARGVNPTKPVPR